MIIIKVGEVVFNLALFSSYQQILRATDDEFIGGFVYLADRGDNPPVELSAAEARAFEGWLVGPYGLGDTLAWDDSYSHNPDTVRLVVVPMPANE